MTNHQADRISFLEHDLKVVQGNLQRADKRIAELEAALATIGEVAAGGYSAQEAEQDDVSVALAAIMDEVDTSLGVDPLRYDDPMPMDDYDLH